MTNDSLLSKHEKNILFEIYEEDGERFVHFSGYFQKTPNMIGLADNLWTPYDMSNSDILLSELMKRNQENLKITHLGGLFPEVEEHPSLPVSEAKATDTLSYLLEERTQLSFYELTENTPCGEYYSPKNSFKRYVMKPLQKVNPTLGKPTIVWAIEDLKTGELFRQKGNPVIFPKEESAYLILQTLNRNALKAQEAEIQTQVITR